MQSFLNWPDQLPPIQLLADHDLPSHAGVLAYPGSTSSERALIRIEPIDPDFARHLREAARGAQLRCGLLAKSSDKAAEFDRES